MLKIGLTGSIGSGKTTVASAFKALGVPVYIADIEAKKFLFDPVVISLIVELVGPEVLTSEGTIDRKALAGKVFSNPEKLHGLNAIIHPRVKLHFAQWSEKYHDQPYVMQESAITFESGFHSLFDLIVVVAAPQEERIQRVLRRDGFTRELVLERIANQWPEHIKVEKADFVIQNSDTDMVLPQLLEIHEELLEISKLRSEIEWKS